MRFIKKLGFNSNHINGDLFGGVTAGIVALPLALAFGLQSGMGAVAGLYGAIMIGFFAALFGGTPTQISGPTAPMTAVSMVIITGILAANEGNLDTALPVILMVFILAGIIQILLGLARLGQYINYIPYPVVSGFMTGIGLIILSTQILPVLGYYAKEDASYIETFYPQAEEVMLERILKEEAAEKILVLEDFQETVRRAKDITPEDIEREATVLAGKNAGSVMGALQLIPLGLKKVKIWELLMALLTIGIIYGFKRITTIIPSTLAALLTVSIVAYFFVPDYRTIGTIPSGFPEIQWSILTQFSFSGIQPFIGAAMTLAVLGAIDSLLTSVVADNLTKVRHNPNQELIGQGIGNSIAAIFGGIPGAGATIRTVVNIHSGGRTKISGMIAAAVLLVVLLVLGPIASYIPAAVLAGVLVTVGLGVMDHKTLGQLRDLPKGEVFIMVTVLLLTVFVGLIEAVAVGMILSCLVFMKSIADVTAHRGSVIPLHEMDDDFLWSDEVNLKSKYGNHVYIKHLDGPLFFGFTSRFQDTVKALPDLDVVIIRMDRVPYVDQSGLYTMEDAIKDLHAQGIRVVFTDLHGQPLKMFNQLKIVPGLIDEQDNFKTFEACAKWLDNYLLEKQKKEQ